ncbi:putative YEF3-translation elongation factor eEF3 [Tilletiaria anomala UBC 951]|uniref:Elongation factor 3 n=1 Tax=Tilletiaria anomala (strain ATCC 24038 / CBS 436.72 / UBC 951) TaxID=1037660 RepID=A0A066WJJ4_TILAU|nr:putative YEF3-translation elongation factor eEF3 [Tilletiaria anomala UBC 951]KDN50815.1 putative YEF3-translation elongation factor eEF3 [Tilletiaria anomala UBC 951]
MSPAVTGVPSTAGTPAQVPAKAAKNSSAATEGSASKETGLEASRLLSSGDKEAVQELVSLVKAEGPKALVSLDIEDVIVKGLADKKNADVREGAANLLSSLCEQGVGHEVEPFIFAKVFESMVEAMGDKEKSVREAALVALRSFVQIMSSWAVPNVLKVLLVQVRTAGKWQVKTGCVALLEELVTASPDRMAAAMPDIIPVMSEVIWDTKTDVQKASRLALNKLCALISNKDIERFIPALITSLINPVEEVPKTIMLLSATTFVQEVDSPTLALMAPLLSRGLNERPTATRRKVAVIIDNMAKLVDNERTVRPFLPKLLPGLIKMETTMADPEARSVVQRAIKTLREIGQVTGDGSEVKPLDDVEVKTTLDLVNKTFKDKKVDNSQAQLVAYIALLAANLANSRNFEPTEWESTLAPYILLNKSATKEGATAIASELLKALAKSTGEEVEIFDDEEEGEDLCNCQFSLAYGAKILLNTATLRLKRSHRYGLCGRNGSGKSTLMRAIQNGQVEGFPSPDVVRTWYVEHDLDGSEGTISIIDFILADKRLDITRDEAAKTLAEMGFDEQRQVSPVAGLSGGWKMKLALARAILFKADILLLDEPTNHLDVVNVAWITNYLQTTSATSIIVSHDSKFLNNVCTDILHLNRFKIKRYPGNLNAFVKRVPEAKAYSELNSGEDYSFKFPEPPLLDGVKTKEKSLLKMRDVTFQYPGTPAPQLKGISMQVSLSSRVAILGPNGSGKSTLVKLMVADNEPNSGEVWKHPNLVIGYVAQHAFHHIDQHLDKTPLDYMLWRYQTGEDLEEMLKNQSKELSEEEKALLKNGEVYVHEGVKRIIESIVARKKLKNSYQYEVSFKQYSSADNLWLSRDELIKRGFEKKVLEFDSKEAQRLGMNRPLVRKEIEQHFEDFGLEREFTSHNTMRGLSGGQKVKVVLAAATWRRPHVIILDEPSNFLDRESLAALINALKTFDGGVCLITHSLEVSEGVCTEVWAMDGGLLRASGHNWIEGQGSGPKLQAKEDEEDKFDAMGNKIEKKEKKKVLSSADKRKAKKDRMAKKKAGTYDSADELDDL